MSNTESESDLDLDKSQLEFKKAIEEYGEGLLEGYSTLKVNIKECETHLFIEVETPGIPKRNISMEIEPRKIEIRASTDQGKDYYNGVPLKIVRQERMMGKFKRVIDLPCKIDINEASASYHEGVLYIEAKKPDESINRGKRELTLY